MGEVAALVRSLSVQLEQSLDVEPTTLKCAPPAYHLAPETVDTPA